MKAQLGTGLASKKIRMGDRLYDQESLEDSQSSDRDEEDLEEQEEERVDDDEVEDRGEVKFSSENVA